MEGYAMTYNPNRKKMSFGEIGKLKREGRLPGSVPEYRFYDGDFDTSKPIVSKEQPANKLDDFIHSLVKFTSDNDMMTSDSTSSVKKDSLLRSQYRLPDENVYSNREQSYSVPYSFPDKKSYSSVASYYDPRVKGKQGWDSIPSSYSRDYGDYKELLDSIEYGDSKGLDSKDVVKENHLRSGGALDVSEFDSEVKPVSTFKSHERQRKKTIANDRQVIKPSELGSNSDVDLTSILSVDRASAYDSALAEAEMQGLYKDGKFLGREEGFFQGFGEEAKRSWYQYKLMAEKYKKFVLNDTDSKYDEYLKVLNDNPNWLPANPDFYKPYSFEDFKDNPIQFLKRATRDGISVAVLQVQSMLHGLKTGLPIGASTAVGALALGNASPLAVMPEEIVTVPSAFMGGLVSGTKIGSGEYIGMVEGGAAYEDYISQGVSPEVAKITATLTGTANTILESTLGFGLGKLPGVKSMVSNIAENKAKDILKMYGKEVAEESIEEGLQNFVSEFMGEVSKVVDSNVYDKEFESLLSNPEQTVGILKNIVKSSVQESVQAVPGIMTAGMPGTAVGLGRKILSPTYGDRKGLKDKYNITDSEMDMLEGVGLPVSDNGLSNEQISLIMQPELLEKLYQYKSIEGKFSTKPKLGDDVDVSLEVVGNEDIAFYDDSQKNSKYSSMDKSEIISITEGQELVNDEVAIYNDDKAINGNIDNSGIGISDSNENHDNNVNKDIKPHSNVAHKIKEFLEGDSLKLSSQQLFMLSDEAYGGSQGEGKYTSKDATDAMELGVNLYIAENMKSEDVTSKDTEVAKATVRKLETMVNRLPTQNKRTEEMVEFQQFSTPPHIAYLSAWVGNVNDSDVVLEPSAGIGGLAVWGKVAGASVVVNELSPRRADILREMDFSQVFTEDAEQIDNILPDDIEPSVVLMNPPFSATAGRMKGKKSTKFATVHIEQALSRLKDNGRLVAIVGKGMADDAVTFSSWWKKIKADYNVRANVGIEGKNYAKYGTTFDIQLLVIDKLGATSDTITGKFDSLEDVINVLGGVRDGRVFGLESHRENKQDANKSSGEEVSSEGKASARGKHDSHVSADELGNISTRNGDTRTEPNKGRFKNVSRTHDVEVKASKANGLNDSSNRRKGISEAEESTGGGGLPSGGAEVVTGGEGFAVSESAIEFESIKKSDRKKVKDLGDSVYSVYTPQKLRIRGAKQHPGNLSQSAAMAAVEPPNLTYKPNLPNKIISDGLLSIAQLETVVYAGQAHEQILPDGNRRGFFIGDGTGVGKGRQIAGIILNNIREGRKKAVWVSKNDRLFSDAKRDWSSLGNQSDEVFSLSKTKLGMSVSKDEGILFTTYGTLAHNLSLTKNKQIQAKANKKARLEQIVDWLGDDFDGVIVFDESHMMQNSIAVKGNRGMKKASIRGLAGVELQKRLPMARIVYVSATGATEVSNLAYAERLGVWGEGTSFSNKSAFISKISEGGLAAMELVARDLKAMGVYIARSLSYDGVKYSTLTHKLSAQQSKIYDTMAKGWQIVLQNINSAMEMTGQQLNGNAKGSALGAFWSSQQRFFNQILTAMQMPSVVEQVKKDIDKGYAVVMQLVNTNESSQNRAIENMSEDDSLLDLDLTPRDILMQYIEHSFPIQQFEKFTDDDGYVRSRAVYDSKGNPVYNKQAIRMKDKLLEELGAMKVPDGVLEIVLNEFGSNNVAEVTGRSRRVIRFVDEASGKFKAKLENRSSNHIAADADAFMDDKKRILIFSDAGGTGKSYHADLSKKNQRLRKHYLIQPGWRADNAVQGFGRTHRTNQAQAPEYILVTTNLKGQKRFISSIARRLDQLGALTKGQRQTGGQGLFTASDNLESSVARDALARFYKDLYMGEVDGFEFVELVDKLGLKDKLTDDYGSLKYSCDELRDIAKFLNRILSLESSIQNEVFDAFAERLESATQSAIANGSIDMGLENYRADRIDKLEESVIRIDDISGAETKYFRLKAFHKVKLANFDRLSRYKSFMGFYRNTKSNSVRAVAIGNSRTKLSGDVVDTVTLYSQRDGGYEIVEKDVFEKGNWVKLSDSEAKVSWDEASRDVPEFDEEELHLISGTMLTIWDKLPQGHVRVMRLLTSGGEILLGRLIKENEVNRVYERLGAERKKGSYDIEEVLSKVLDKNYKVELDNGWSIQRKRVANEFRLELIGVNLWEFSEQLKSEGVFTETISFKTRYFIPTGDRAIDVLKNVVRYRPINDVVAPEAEASYGYSNDSEMMVKDSKNVKYPTLRKDSINNTSSSKVKTVDELVDIIEKTLGVPIRTGKIRHRALGIFKVQPEVIRTKISNNIPIIAHELGHYLDKSYHLAQKDFNEELVALGLATSKASYSNAKKRKEGVAEFVRLYLTDLEEAKLQAPKFFSYFESNMLPDVRVFLGELRSEISKLQSLPSYERTLNDISFFESRKATKLNNHNFLEKIADAWLDEQLAFKRVQDEIGSGSSHDNFAMKAENYRGVEAKVKGNLILAQTDLFGNEVGECLKDILEPISKKDYKHFANYLVSNRASDYEAKGFVMPQSYEDYVEGVNFYEGEYPHFRKVYLKIRAWEDNNLQLLVDSEIMSQEKVDDIKKNNPNHIPLYRIQEAVDKARTGSGNTLGRSKSVIKKASGSGKTIIDPIESLIADAYIIRGAAEANDVMKTLAEQSEITEGLGWAIEKVPPKMRGTSFVLGDVEKQLKDMGIDTDDADVEELLCVFKANYSPRINEVIIYRQGKPLLYQLDSQLFKAVKGLNREASHIIIRVMSRVKGVLQTGVVSSVKFIMRNIARDFGSALVNSEADINPIDLVKGYISACKKDEWYRRFVLSGGSTEWILANDRKQIQNAVRNIMSKGFADRFLGVLLHPIESMKDFAEFTEAGARIAEFRKTVDKSGDELLAAQRARDITIDFKKHGYYGKEINKVTAFFNANVQGQYKMFRTFKKHPYKTMVKGFVYITLPTLILHAINGDNEEYESMSIYRKALFYNFPIKSGKQFISVPKPFDWGVIFGAIPEFILDSYRKNDREAYEEIMDAIKLSFGADFMPQIIKPYREAHSNIDWKGQPIEHAGDDRVSPYLRYGEKTSTVAKSIANAIKSLPIPEVFKSPKKLDYMIKGYFGTVGAEIRDIPDTNFKEVWKLFTNASNEPSELTVVSSFVTKPLDFPKELGDFYEEYSRMQRLFYDSKKLGELLSRSDKLLYNRLKHFYKLIGRERDVIRDIEKSSKLDSKEKSKRIEAHKYKIRKYARLGLIRDVSKDE